MAIRGGEATPRLQARVRQRQAFQWRDTAPVSDGRWSMALNDLEVRDATRRPQGLQARPWRGTASAGPPQRLEAVADEVREIMT